MPDIVPFLRARIDRLVALLALPPRAAQVLGACAAVAVDPAVASKQVASDPHQRSGVVPWLRLAREAGDAAAMQDLEEAVLQLHAWGVVQIVGMELDDPVVGGDAPLRLTGLGRAAVGLAPARLRPVSPDAARSWQVWHGASRERLLDEASGRGDALVSFHDGGLQPSWLCAQIALAIQMTGRVVLDATLASEKAIATVLAAALRRTSVAPVERIVLVADPAGLRATALEIDAELRWVEPEPVARRHGQVLDARVGAALAEHRPGARIADLAGVPDVETAVPRRSATRWEEVVVPREIRHQLDQALQHARFRLRPGGRGYRLLLSGSPGTGKSMLARALAHALDRPYVALDLSSVLSRWMGETEQNLSRIFDVAEASDAILVLDEAEALLRQRNGEGGGEAMAIAVAYLLTRLDRFEGLLVGTTNRVRELDEAFFRRFDDYIVMPVPDEPTRRQIWEATLRRTGVPSTADLDLLARRFALPGGSIEGAVERAAAWAVAGDSPITTPLALASLYRELEKGDRAPTEVLVEPWREAVEKILRG